MRLVRAQVPDAQLLVVGPTDSDKPDAITPETAARVRAERRVVSLPDCGPTCRLCTA